MCSQEKIADRKYFPKTQAELVFKILILFIKIAVFSHWQSTFTISINRKHPNIMLLKTGFYF